jgi:hypothetical protein
MSRDPEYWTLIDDSIFEFFVVPLFWDRSSHCYESFIDQFKEGITVRKGSKGFCSGHPVYLSDNES